MSVDVASFDDFETLGGIERVQRGLVQVFLEGPDDVTLFSQFWFQDYLDRLDFKRPTRAGGCEAVVAAVARARREGGMPVYGIVDRDAWRRRKEVRTFLDVDDASFGRREIGPFVFVTLLWEVEAYLLQPEMVHVWVSTSWPRAPVEPCSGADMMRRMTSFCECLLEITGLNMILHHFGVSEVPLFGLDLNDVSRLRELVSTKVDEMPAGPEREAVREQMAELLDVVRSRAAFLAERAKLDFLLRFVDSKALIAKLVKVFKLSDGRIWPLAQHMKSQGRRPEELTGMLERILAAPPQM